MLRKKHLYIISICIIFMFIVIIIFSVRALNKLDSKEVKRVQKQIETDIENEIRLLVLKLDGEYKIRQVQYDDISENFLKNTLYKEDVLNTTILKNIWKRTKNQMNDEHLYNINDENLGNVIHALKTATINKADVYSRGTQLKILLELQGGQKAVFKPQWYSKEEIIYGKVYAGNDRYGAEILGFYLSGILDMPYVPITTERVISLKNEIAPVASKVLKDTIFEKDNKTCVYGKCFYCVKEKAVCENNTGKLHGAIIINVPGKFTLHRSPWQRTYKAGKKAPWEDKSNREQFCKYVRSQLSENRILDLIDTSIFDFLIQNGDRHHYETLKDKVLLFDNGKGLGNPHVHHLDILAPLYQCCSIRKSTWERLKTLSGGMLGEILESIPELRKVVSDTHIKAIDERLLYIYATVELCQNKYILLYD